MIAGEPFVNMMSIACPGMCINTSRSEYEDVRSTYQFS